MSDRDDRAGERDDYWDIEKLVPKKHSTLRPFATEVRVTTHIVEPASSPASPTREESERRLSFGESVGINESVEESYVPEGGGLIKKVTISKTVDKYDFYESFRRSALLYYDCVGNKCDYAEFYSYMPQYAHMTKTQQAYYLYWRSEVRRGRYIKSDYSYIYLYVYEILNLPDKIPAEEGVKLMTGVWRAYRELLPRLDNYMSIWLQDYCLVHKLSCPLDEIRDFIGACLKNGVIKEFYLSDVTNLTLENTELLLAYLSDYDWRGGRVMDSVAGNKLGVITSHEDYRRELLSAMRGVIRDLWDTRILPDGEKHTTVRRDAFPHSLCTHSVKSRLTVEYISFSGSEDIRREVTVALRYTENKLRQLLGVKSRLAVKELPDRAKSIIDAYFDAFFKAAQRKRREESRPSYERLYDVENTVLSFEGADEIERVSWLTTERLVVEDDDMAEPNDAISVLASGENSAEACAYATVELAPAISEPPPESIETHGVSLEERKNNISQEDEDAEGGATPFTADELAFLSFLVGQNGSYVLPTRPVCDMLAEKINVKFLDELGDVVLEYCDFDGKYTVIEDYIEEVNACLKRRI